MDSSKFESTQLRPFVLSDLKPVPQGWQIKGPKFVGIGAMKAGTSYWYHMLLDHPQIVKNRLKRKELRYFVHFGHRGLSEENISTYLSAFAVPPGSISGEWSPIYLHYPICFKYLAQAVPNAKILIILRNPVDAVLSAVNEAAHHIHKFGLDDDPLYVFNVLQVYPWAVNIYFYASHLKRLLKYYHPDQLLVMQYEKCKINPGEEIARTFRFLGVDDKYEPKNINQAINRKDYYCDKLLPKERMILAEYYSGDVQETIKMFPEIDKSLWVDFND